MRPGQHPEVDQRLDARLARPGRLPAQRIAGVAHVEELDLGVAQQRAGGLLGQRRLAGAGVAVVVVVQDVGEHDQLGVAFPAPDEMPAGQVVQVVLDKVMVAQLLVALGAARHMLVVAQRDVRGDRRGRPAVGGAPQFDRRVRGAHGRHDVRPPLPIHILYDRRWQPRPAGDLAALLVDDRGDAVAGHGQDRRWFLRPHHISEVELRHHRRAFVPPPHRFAACPFGGDPFGILAVDHGPPNIPTLPGAEPTGPHVLAWPGMVWRDPTVGGGRTVAQTADRDANHALRARFEEVYGQYQRLRSGMDELQTARHLPGDRRIRRRAGPGNGRSARSARRAGARSPRLPGTQRRVAGIKITATVRAPQRSVEEVQQMLAGYLPPGSGAVDFLKDDTSPASCAARRGAARGGGARWLTTSVTRPGAGPGGGADMVAAGKALKGLRTGPGAKIAAASAGSPWGTDDIGTAFEKKYRPVEQAMLARGRASRATWRG